MHVLNRRKLYFFSALVVTSATIALLITGSPLLTKALDNENAIPLGTFITWAGMISLPLTVYWGVQELRNPSNQLTTVLSGLLKGIIILAILWVPLSYLLAGNLSFSFTEKESFQGGQTAMRWFWRLSYGIAIGSIATLFTYWISLLLRKIKTHSNNGFNT